MQGTGTLSAYAGQTATLTGSGSLSIVDYDALIQGEGTLTATASQFGAAELAGTSVLFAYSTAVASGRAFLHPVVSIGGSVNYAFTAPQSLSAFYGDANDSYVPPPPVSGIVFLPPLSSYGYANVPDGEGEASLHSVMSRGGDYNYALGTASLQPISAFGMYQSNYEMNLVSRYVLLSGADFVHDLVLIINSQANIVSAFSVAREVAIEMLSSLTASDSIVYSAELSMSLLSSTKILNRLVSGNELASGRVWVVNLNNGATAQYDNYAFNSFFEKDGDYYGVADDGIYRLDGEDDDGVDIDAFVQVGDDNLGTAQRKSVLNVYAGVSSTGKMLLKVDVDGVEYTYEARSNNSDIIKNHRFDVGRGLQGNYYDFTLLNQNGDDFDLESVVFEPIKLTRKI